MDKNELLFALNVQKEMENITNNTLAEKRKRFADRVEKLKDRINNSFNEMFPKEIIDVINKQGCYDIKTKYNGVEEILRLYCPDGYCRVMLINPNRNNTTIAKYSEKWSLSDFPCNNDVLKANESQLKYFSERLDMYEFIINETEKRVGEFYQKIAEHNQARIDRRNAELAATNTGDADRPKKTYQIIITVEE